MEATQTQQQPQQQEADTRAQPQQQPQHDSRAPRLRLVDSLQQSSTSPPAKLTPKRSVLRGRLYDCEVCGREFRKRVLPHEDNLELVRCLSCIHDGPPCFGCGERSKLRRVGSMFCKPCREPRSSKNQKAARARMLADARARGAARGPADGAFVNGNTKALTPEWRRKGRVGSLGPWVNRTAKANRAICLYRESGKAGGGSK